MVGSMSMPRSCANGARDHHRSRGLRPTRMPILAGFRLSSRQRSWLLGTADILWWRFSVWLRFVRFGLAALAFGRPGYHAQVARLGACSGRRSWLFGSAFMPRVACFTLVSCAGQRSVACSHAQVVCCSLCASAQHCVAARRRFASARSGRFYVLYLI